MEDKDFHELERKVDVLEERQKSDKVEWRGSIATGLALLRQEIAQRDRDQLLAMASVMGTGITLLVAIIVILEYLRG